MLNLCWYKPSKNYVIYLFIIAFSMFFTFFVDCSNVGNSFAFSLRWICVFLGFPYYITTSWKGHFLNLWKHFSHTVLILKFRLTDIMLLKKRANVNKHMTKERSTFKFQNFRTISFALWITASKYCIVGNKTMTVICNHLIWRFFKLPLKQTLATHSKT